MYLCFFRSVCNANRSAYAAFLHRRITDFYFDIPNFLFLYIKMNVKSQLKGQELALQKSYEN